MHGEHAEQQQVASPVVGGQPAPAQAPPQLGGMLRQPAAGVILPPPPILV